MKIDLAEYNQIRELYLHHGMSQRAIAKQLHISRNTVAKYCKGENVPWERKDYSPRSSPVITDEVRAFILRCYAEDSSHGFKKQKHTAKRIHERLVEELHFTGSYTAVRCAVPKRTIFDNAAVAVSEGLDAYVTKETKRYEELKAHYQFNTTYCNPSSGNEKGLVEKLVGYVRRNALVPMPGS